MKECNHQHMKNYYRLIIFNKLYKLLNIGVFFVVCQTRLGEFIFINEMYFDAL